MPQALNLAEAFASLDRRNPRRAKQRAFVVATVRHGDEIGVELDKGKFGFDGVIAGGTEELIRDLEEAGLMPEVGDSLGLAPGPGFWIWEGHMVTTRSYEGDYDVDYRGKFRRATFDEIATVAKGDPLWPWSPASVVEDDGTEDGS